MTTDQEQSFFTVSYICFQSIMDVVKDSCESGFSNPVLYEEVLVYIIMFLLYQDNGNSHNYTGKHVHWHKTASYK